MSSRSSFAPPRLLRLLPMLLCSFFAIAQTKPVDAAGHQWWQHAVFYEIYPRSFADSNDDGVGDLNGISSKMSYLHELGVDAIWITPCYPSPQVDFGYDVSDYLNIDPMYGNLADFDRMVADGKKRHVRIIMDFVPNHTSDQHPWFLDSKSSRPPRIATGISGVTAKRSASLLITGSLSSAARHGRSIRALTSFIITSSMRNNRT